MTDFMSVLGSLKSRLVDMLTWTKTVDNPNASLAQASQRANQTLSGVTPHTTCVQCNAAGAGLQAVRPQAPAIGGTARPIPNLDAAIAHLQENISTQQFGEGLCATKVREALQAGGANFPDMTGSGSAKDYGHRLEAAGMTTVEVPDDYAANGPFQRGDVVIIQDATGYPHGHMAMYDGTQWISDFPQRDMWGGRIRDQAPDYEVYRFAPAPVTQSP